MGDAAAYAYLSTEQAIRDAELNEAELSSSEWSHNGFGWSIFRRSN